MANDNNKFFIGETAVRLFAGPAQITRAYIGPSLVLVFDDATVITSSSSSANSSQSASLASSSSSSNFSSLSSSSSRSSSSSVSSSSSSSSSDYLSSSSSVSSSSSSSDYLSSSSSDLFAITAQPKNDYATASNQNVTFSVGVVGGDTPTYQWQYYGPNYDISDYDYKWRDIPSATSSSYTTNGSTLSAAYLLSYDFYYTGGAKLRCVVTASGGSPALTSDVIRFLELDYMHYPNLYWYGNQGNYVNYGQPQTFSPSSGENLVFDLYDYAMSSVDTSWYTGNDTTVKVQVATTGYTNSADWTDLYTQDFRGYFYLTGYNITPDTGTKYYRVIAVDKWPRTVNNGTQSATHATQAIYPHSNYDVVQVTWP